MDWSKLSFGERLKLAREGAGVTQDEMATKLGVDQVQISKYERSVTAPRSVRLEPIAEALGDVTYLTWLLTGRGKVPPVTKRKPPGAGGQRQDKKKEA